MIVFRSALLAIPTSKKLSIVATKSSTPMILGNRSFSAARRKE